MKIERSVQDTGLEPNQLFKPEALDYWLQYDPQTFLEAITHEIRDKVFRIEQSFNLIQGIYPIPISEDVAVSEDVKQDLKEAAVRTIHNNKGHLYDIAATMWSYSKNYNFSDVNDTKS
ncbi:MAG TPA: hypothetical protein VHL11_23940 [Phototrophicaceae bacterium]|jgi:hypothetical protein|nr:hypothetical protein [Phototrophicaceae bacterium]